jgi:YhcH/YjgK/YiaL family protein
MTPAFSLASDFTLTDSGECEILSFGDPMILDKLTNAQLYESLHPRFTCAFAFLAKPELPQLPVGRYEIDGERIYAMVQRGPGRSREGAFLEAHERYIDIQLVLAGTDDMGWCPRSLCREITKAYDDTADVAFYGDAPSAWISVGAGSFVIFFPGDAHLPSISAKEIHKVVVKIAV